MKLLKEKDLRLKALMIAQKRAWEDLQEVQYQMKDPLLWPNEVEYMKGILAHKEQEYQRVNDELRAYMNEKGGTSHA